MRSPGVWVTYERLRELLAYSKKTGIFTWRRPTSRKHKRRDVAGSLVGHGYIHIEIDGRSYGAHRLAWLYVHGVWPSGQIDHENGMRADNRFSNLRDGSRAFNQQNQRRAQSRSLLGLLGVSRSGNRFKARIVADGAQRHIGTFNTPDEAHQAYIRAKRVLHAGGCL